MSTDDHMHMMIMMVPVYALLAPCEHDYHIIIDVSRCVMWQNGRLNVEMSNIKVVLHQFDRNCSAWRTAYENMYQLRPWSSDYLEVERERDIDKQQFPRKNKRKYLDKTRETTRKQPAETNTTWKLFSSCAFKYKPICIFDDLLILPFNFFRNKCALLSISRLPTRVDCIIIVSVRLFACFFFFVCCCCIRWHRNYLELTQMNRRDACAFLFGTFMLWVFKSG